MMTHEGCLHHSLLGCCSQVVTRGFHTDGELTCAAAALAVANSFVVCCQVLGGHTQQLCTGTASTRKLHTCPCLTCSRPVCCQWVGHSRPVPSPQCGPHGERAPAAGVHGWVGGWVTPSIPATCSHTLTYAVSAEQSAVLSGQVQHVSAWVAPFYGNPGLISQDTMPFTVIRTADYATQA
jgi:hypothetical protein